MSTSQTTGFGGSLTLSPDGGGSVAATTIYVRFSPTAEQSYNEDIIHTSAGATDQSIAVSGTGVQNSSSSITFSSTTSTYSENDDLTLACTSELGDQYKLADWLQIESYYQQNGSLLTFFDDVDLNESEGKSMLVQRNGNRWYTSDRHYLIARHDGNRPSGFFAHDNINNYELSLGSWYGLNYRVLCYTDEANNPPTTGGEPITVNYVEGWNLISIPEEMSGQKMSDYFSQTISTDVFEFSGNYNPVTSPTNGKAYWVKLNSNETVEFNGNLLGNLTLDLAKGWNLVGTIADTLNISTDIQDPGSIIENNIIWKVTFNSSSGEYEMVEASQMLPGYGYFIKATASGTVTLSKQ